MTKYDFYEDFWGKHDKICDHVARLGDQIKNPTKVEKALELMWTQISCTDLFNGFQKTNYDVYFDDNSNKYEMFRDTTFAFILNRNNEGHGLLGFNFRGDSIIVEQIQGKKGIFLHTGWDQMLLRIAIRYAVAYDFESINIKIAERLSYYNLPIRVPNQGLTYHKLLLHKRYDFLAIINGFEFNEEEGEYKLKLK